MIGDNETNFLRKLILPNRHLASLYKASAKTFQLL